MALAKRDEGSKVNSNINVTPMVDVMLVLLIIFMVITPMLQKGVSVDMAKVNSPAPMPDADKEDALLISIMRLHQVRRPRPLRQRSGSGGQRPLGGSGRCGFADRTEEGGSGSNNAATPSEIKGVSYGNDEWGQ